MKITKEEKQYIVDKTNELLNLYSKNIYNDINAYTYYKTDIINAFTKTKKYQEVLKEFKKIGVDKDDININIVSHWEDTEQYPYISFIVNTKKIKLFDTELRMGISGAVGFIINDRPLTQEIIHYNLRDISDVRLMEKVILAQDLKVKNKAPEIDKIINNLVNEIKSTYNIENYKDEAIKYIEKNY